MGPAASAIAARCAPGVAEPSGPVIALPPSAITTRRAGLTSGTLVAVALAVKYHVRPAGPPHRRGQWKLYPRSDAYDVGKASIAWRVRLSGARSRTGPSRGGSP